MNRLFLALVIAVLALIRPAVAANAPQNFVLHNTPKPLPEITFTDQTGPAWAIVDGKLYLNGSKEGLVDWQRDPIVNIAKAQKRWDALSQ